MIKRIIYCYTVHYVTVSAKDGQLVPSQENTYKVESQRTLSEEKLLAKVNRIAKGAVITAVDHSIRWKILKLD